MGQSWSRCKWIEYDGAKNRVLWDPEGLQRRTACLLLYLKCWPSVSQADFHWLTENTKASVEKMYFVTLWGKRSEIWFTYTFFTLYAETSNKYLRKDLSKVWAKAFNYDHSCISAQKKVTAIHHCLLMLKDEKKCARYMLGGWKWRGWKSGSKFVYLAMLFRRATQLM